MMDFFDANDIMKEKSSLIDLLNKQVDTCQMNPHLTLNLGSVIDLIKKLDFSSLNLEKIQRTCLSLLTTEEDTQPEPLCKLFYQTQNYLKNNIPIIEKMRMTVLVTLVGISVCIHVPKYSMQKAIPDIIWREHVYELCKEINDLLETASELNMKSDGKLEVCFNGFLNVIKTVFFNAVIHILAAKRKGSIKKENIRYFFYFASYYLCVIGDVCKFRKPIPLPETYIEFYTVSSQVWPRYSRPYQCLALHYLKKDLLYEAIYYYSRSFLCMMGQERFTVAKADLSRIVDLVTKKAQSWNQKFNSFKFKKYTKFNDLKHQTLYVIIIQDFCYPVSVSTNDNLTLFRAFARSSVILTQTCSPSIKKDFYKILFNNFIFSFLSMNINIILDVGHDDFEETFEKWEAQFIYLQRFNEFYTSSIFESLPSFAIIMIYSFECVFHENSQQCNQISNVSVKKLLKIFLSFSRVVVGLLVSTKSEGLKIPLVKFLSLFSKCVVYYIKFMNVRLSLNDETLSGNIFLFVELFNYTNKLNIKSCNSINSYFKILGSSALQLLLDSSCWDSLELSNSNLYRLEDYAAHVRSEILSIIDLPFIPLKIVDGVCVFDSKLFSEKNIHTFPNYESFIQPLKSYNNDRLNMFLYDYAVHLDREEISINVISYICPDTNTFLVNKSCILKNQLFQQIDILLPTIVVKELVGLYSNKNNKNPQSVVDSAQDAYNQLMPYISTSSHVKILTTQGTVARFNESFVIVHDVGRQYDDVILDCLLEYEKKIGASIVGGKCTINFHPILFVSNDHLFRLKVLNAGIPTIDSKLLYDIQRLINSES